MKLGESSFFFADKTTTYCYDLRTEDDEREKYLASI